MKNRRIAALLRWLPRVLSVGFILFVSAFALDVLGEKDWLWALAIHLIPSYILVFLTVAAWKHKLFGGAGFVLAGIAFAVVSRLEGAVLYGPTAILGLLFLLDWWYERRRG